MQLPQLVCNCCCSRPLNRSVWLPEHVQFAINKFATSTPEELRNLTGAAVSERFILDDSVYIDPSFDIAVASNTPPSAEDGAPPPPGPSMRRRLVEWTRDSNQEDEELWVRRWCSLLLSVSSVSAWLQICTCSHD